MATEALTVKRSELLEALSQALDLIMGQKSGHCQRTGRIAVAIGQRIGFSEAELTALHYAALLKDSGCATIRGALYKLLRGDDIKYVSGDMGEEETNILRTLRQLSAVVAPDANVFERATRILGAVFELPKTIGPAMTHRVERSAAIASKLGFPRQTQDAVTCYLERWDGKGVPRGMRGRIIPAIAMVLAVAMSAEILSTRYGRDVAVKAIEDRSGKWFDPDTSRAFIELAATPEFWRRIDKADGDRSDWEPQDDAIELALDDDRLRNIAEAFGEIVDSKSEFTASHSQEVSFVAEGIARGLGIPEDEILRIRIAALLHDVGKLSVPNSILDSPGKLTDQQREVVRKHPAHSHQILRVIAAFDEVAVMAGSHHERIDGQGYPRGVGGDDLLKGSQIIAVADVYQALKADRPYRQGLEEAQVVAHLEREAGSALDSDAVRALKNLL